MYIFLNILLGAGIVVGFALVTTFGITASFYFTDNNFRHTYSNVFKMYVLEMTGNSRM